MNAEHPPKQRAFMMNEPRRSTAAMALAAAGCLLLAACGGGSSGSAATSSSTAPSVTVGGDGASSDTSAHADIADPKAASDPCSLLTQAQVDTAAGQPLGAGKANIPLGDCTWSSSDFTANVDVTVSTWSAIKTAATANGHTPSSLSGVGDEALDNGPLLSVRKGDTGFLLVLGGPSIDSAADHGLAQEKILATAILSRI
jgi:hypothetical protein